MRHSPSHHCHLAQKTGRTRVQQCHHATHKTRACGSINKTTSMAWSLTLVNECTNQENRRTMHVLTGNALDIHTSKRWLYPASLRGRVREAQTKSSTKSREAQNKEIRTLRAARGRRRPSKAVWGERRVRRSADWGEARAQSLSESNTRGRAMLAGGAQG
jgi:hypothetical protein